MESREQHELVVSYNRVVRFYTGVEGFEPSTAGLGGQCYILTKPYAHNKMQ